VFVRVDDVFVPKKHRINDDDDMLIFPLFHFDFRNTETSL